MKNNLKLILITLFCAAILLPGYLVKKNLITAKKPDFMISSPSLADHKQAKQYYQSWLSQHEDNLWKEVEMLFGVTQEKVNELKKEWQHEYDAMVEELREEEKSDQPLSEENKKIVYEILNDYTIDPQSITLVSWTNSSSGGSTDKTIFINEDEMKYMPLIVKKFVIAHEIGHIVNKDHSTAFVFAKLRQMQPEKETEFSEFMKTFAQFKELRADITAMLQNDDYIKGQYLYFDHHVQCALTAGVKDEDKDLRYVIGHQFKETLLA